VADGPVFYLDIASPECLLTAERILGVMPVATEWVPVNLGRPDVDFEAVAHTAHVRGLQPLRQPASFPFDGANANRAATYAKQIGRSVAFAQAALRQAYAGGRDLSDVDNIVVAASACEMHPTAVVKALELRSVDQALADATRTAVERGVTRTPAVWVPEAGVFEGDDALGAAAEAAA
jgi:2-hydroxychromene-2-carboxylate isomerase